MAEHRYAALGGYERVVGLLLYRKDFSLNRLDKYDRALYWWPAAKAHEGAVKLLLEREMSTPII